MPLEEFAKRGRRLESESALGADTGPPEQPEQPLFGALERFEQGQLDLVDLGLFGNNDEG